MAGFFEDDLPVNSDPVDTTEITTTQLYFSSTEQELFKKLCKTGMKAMWPNDFKEKANLPDFLLTVLKERYGNH